MVSRILRKLGKWSFGGMYLGFPEWMELFACSSVITLADHLVKESSRSGSVEIRPAVRRAVTNFVLRYVFSVRVPFSSESNLQNQAQNNNNISQMRLFKELVNVTDQIWSKLTYTQTTMADLLAPPDVTTRSSYALRRLVQRRDYLLREIV